MTDWKKKVESLKAEQAQSEFKRNELKLLNFEKAKHFLQSLNVEKKLSEIRDQLWGIGYILIDDGGSDFDWWYIKISEHAQWAMNKLGYSKDLAIRDSSDEPKPPNYKQAQAVLDATWPRLKGTWGSTRVGDDWEQYFRGYELEEQHASALKILCGYTGEQHGFAIGVDISGTEIGCIFAKTISETEQSFDELLTAACAYHSSYLSSHPWRPHVASDISEIKRILIEESSNILLSQSEWLKLEEWIKDFDSGKTNLYWSKRDYFF